MIAVFEYEHSCNVFVYSPNKLGTATTQLIIIGQCRTKMNKCRYFEHYIILGNILIISVVVDTHVSAVELNWLHKQLSDTCTEL